MSDFYPVGEEVADAGLVVLEHVRPHPVQVRDRYRVRMLCCGDVREFTRQQILDRSKRGRSSCSACVGEWKRKHRAVPSVECGMPEGTVWVNGVPWPPLGLLGERHARYPHPRSLEQA